jgi:N-acetylglutamate synthase-like GNAT family acetyltransferase
MNIVYSQEKNFTAETLLDFFTKSGNPDAKYGEALVKAMNNSTVIHAWDKDADEIAALISVIDDGATTAYIRYLIVAPNYRGKGINDELIAQVKAKYADYPFVYAFTPNDFHASFFTKLGFNVIDNMKVLAR